MITALTTTAGLRGWVVEPGAVEGTLRRGIVMRNLRVAGPGFEARVPVLRARARLLPLLRGKVELEEVELENPEVLAAPEARPGERVVPVRTAAPARWSFDVGRWTIHGGVVRLAKGPKLLRELRDISATGTAAAGIVTVERATGRAGPVSWSGTGRASVSPPSASARLRALFEGLEASGAVSWRPEGTRLEGRWSGAWKKLRTKGEFSGSVKEPRVKGEVVSRAPPARLTVSGGPKDHRLEISVSSGPATARASGRGRLDGPLWRARWSGLRVSGPYPGRATGPFDTVVEGKSFSLDGLTLVSDDGRLTADVEARNAELEVTSFEWRAPEGRVTGWARAGAKRYEARVKIEDLGLERYARPPKGVVLERPRLNADLVVRSSTSGPLIEGEAVVQAARLTYDLAGLTVDAPSATLGADGRRLVVRSSHLPLRRGGQARLAGALTREGPELLLTAENVEFAFIDGAKGEADVAARLMGGWRALEVKGDVFVAKAEYRPPRKKTAPPKAAPEVAASTAPARPRASLHYDVRALADRDVWFRDKQTAIELKGDVRARGRAGKPPEITGRLETVHGQVAYLGRMFQITRARASLTGEDPPDPALDARAEWIDPRTRTRVNLALTGTGKQPKLELSSEPPMDRRDILSFLAFGRPLYEVGRARGEATTEEAAALVADYLAQGLGQYLPVDLFNVKLTENQKADVSVGRYLTRNLFLSYGQTFERQGEKRVAADYRLNDQWSLQTQSYGGGRYVLDLLFNYGIR